MPGFIMWIYFLFTLNSISSANSNSLRDRLQKNAKRPPDDGKPPLDVKVGIYIESLGKFQSTEMSFDVDLYLYMSWKDPTLNHTNPDYVLINDPKVRDHLWLPDLYFANARSAYFHDVTIPNFSMFIAQDGTIAYSTRVTLTVACNLQLAHYPIDHQTCNIRILSCKISFFMIRTLDAYIANQVNVTWYNRGAVRHNAEIGLPEFRIKNMTADYCDGTYVYAITDKSFKKDQFSCLEGKLYLSRSIGYHLVQSYIPTGLIVIISWVSFWIDRRAVPARVTLSFTTLLSLSTLGNGLRFGLPQVSYAKAIDYWFGACMVFVFMALLEFALVNSYMRKASKYEKLSKCMEKRKASKMSEPDEDGPYFPPLSKDSTVVFTTEDPRLRGVEKRNGSAKNHNTKSSYSIRIAQQYEDRQHETLNGDIPKLDLADNDMRCMHGPTSKCETCMVDSIRLIDESPTKTTFLTDDENDHPSQYLAPPKIPSSRRRFRTTLRDANPLGVNHFLQLGFINSRKGLRVDKMSRILFPLFFVLFNLLYWSYYLVYLEEHVPFT